MRSVKLGWMILLTLLTVLSGGGYYLYARQEQRFDRHAANIREIKKLKEQQAKLMQVPEKSEDETEVLKILASQKGELWFLEDIEEQLGLKAGPRFLLIGPVKREEKSNHVVFSRQVSLEAGFSELMRLLDILETKRGFRVSRLQIMVNPVNPKRHRIDFWLSCIRIKESFLAQLGLDAPLSGREGVKVASLLLDLPFRAGEKLVLEDELGDPFLKLEPRKTRGPQKKALAKRSRRRRRSKPLALAPIDLAGEYTLQGIVKVAGRRMALIAPDRVLEEGDWLGKKQLVEIRESKVIFQAGRQKYFLKLPGDSRLPGKNSSKAQGLPKRVAAK